MDLKPIMQLTWSCTSPMQAPARFLAGTTAPAHPRPPPTARPAPAHPRPRLETCRRRLFPNSSCSRWVAKKGRVNTHLVQQPEEQICLACPPLLLWMRDAPTCSAGCALTARTRWLARSLHAQHDDAIMQNTYNGMTAVTDGRQSADGCPVRGAAVG